MRALCWFCVTVLAMGFGGRALAATLDLDGEVDIKITSSYSWRGEIINDEPCFQPSVTFFADPLSFNLWGTWDVRHNTHSSARARINATVDYTIESDGSLFTPGMVAYIYHDDFRGRARDTFEIFLIYTLDTWLLPSLTMNYDFVDIKGAYISGAVRHSVDLIKDKLSLDMRADVGWADTHYVQAKFSLPAYAEAEERTFEPDKSALLDLTVSVSLPMIFAEDFMIVPALKYMRLLDANLREAYDDAGLEVDDFGGSLSLTFYF